MAEQPSGKGQEMIPADRYDFEEVREPGLVDGIRFLYERRVRLAIRFIVLLGIGVIGFLYLRYSMPSIVRGTLGLTFRGMERHEYPSGKKFSVEDFRSPELLSKALSDAGVPKGTIDARELAAHVYVDPVIPADIQGRWRRQERDGARKDEYFPNEFDIGIQISGLSNDQKIRFFDALVQRYQERVKYEQKSALSFVTTADASYDKFAAAYDYWDIPGLFRDSYRSLDSQISTLIVESLQFQDSKYQLAFRDLSRELRTWMATRLQALEALTYQGRLVKNRDIMIQRVQYRIEDVDIQIKQKTREALEAERLLGLVDRPRALLTSQLNNERGLPLVDVSALDKLIKSDYIGPLVERISKLQQDTQALEADKMRLERQLSWLPKAANVDLAQLPPGYQELIQTLSSELKAIIQSHNRLLDEYLTATITSLVMIRQSPIITREGSSATLILAVIVVMAGFLAIVVMSVEHLFQKARGLAGAPPEPNKAN